MIVNPLKEAAPLTIYRLRNLLSDYENCLNARPEDPRQATRLCKAIMAEFMKDFCSLFGKTASVTDEDRGYLKFNVSPQTIDAPLAQWLSRARIMVPKEGESFESGHQIFILHSGEIRTIMSQVKLSLDEHYPDESKKAS